MDYDTQTVDNQTLQKALLSWFAREKRSMPWRDRPEPYYVWLSEIMLQQTRVDTVLPYFTGFISRFPNISSLAHAPLQDVLKAWEGLGYYSRARNLHKAAQIIDRDYSGFIPNDYERLLALPGIGEYTAGAVMSIAYQQPYPAVDGNVLRVLSRIFMIHDDIGQPKTRKHMQRLAGGLIPPGGARDFNQALMELGARVCLPKNARCGSCPAASVCKAKLLGLQESLPVKMGRVQVRTVRRQVLLIVHGHHVLARCREESLLSGLWEFPAIEDDVHYPEALSVATALAWCREHSLTPLDEKVRLLQHARHVFTHLVWEMEGMLVPVQQALEVMGYEWITQKQLRELPFPTALRIYHQMALDHFVSVGNSGT